ncbi:MAG: mechanosensitive ion channel family protein [Xanthomonadales bacterium]|nr:Small-conductance mechanosensitive channel [Xanthomonadales bacterium]MCC6594179.1 mechanosensitive ion channel family protein [Xanthomonadales bacterium]MCE7931665.1 mechanosensitive ion channel family protein [Xanthomonadales bacterium PRO6]
MTELLRRLFDLPWASYAAELALRLTLALWVLLLGLWLARLALKVLARLLQRFNVDPMLADFLRNLASGALVVVVTVGALDQAGVPMSSILAALGAAGLAIALALRDSLSNLAAGVMLILLKPFRAGDLIGIGGQTGKVESLRLMHTVLLTPDNCELVLPNNRVASEPILNYTARATRRIDLVIGIAYRDDVGRAFSIMRGVLDAEPRILREPSPQLLVDKLAESSVDLAIRPWVATGDYLEVRANLLRRLKEALAAAGIDVPFPQRELRVVHENAPTPAVQLGTAAD